MSNISIHKASPEDAIIVTNLIVELFLELNSKRDDKFIINPDKYLPFTQDLLNNPKCACFLAYNSNKLPIAVITVANAFAIYNFGEFGVITELFVNINYRSASIGKKLIEEAIQFSKSQGWSRLEVGAPMFAVWPRTFDFYIRSGFKEKGPKLRIEF